MVRSWYVRSSHGRGETLGLRVVDCEPSGGPAVSRSTMRTIAYVAELSSDSPRTIHTSAVRRRAEGRAALVVPGGASVVAPLVVPGAAAPCATAGTTAGAPVSGVVTLGSVRPPPGCPPGARDVHFHARGALASAPLAWKCTSRAPGGHPGGGRTLPSVTTPETGAPAVVPAAAPCATAPAEAGTTSPAAASGATGTTSPAAVAAAGQ